MRVSLFVTCLIDQLYPEIGLSTVKILRRFGVDVHFDRRQTCCGQPAFNTGYTAEARQVARHFLDVYADSAAIVVPSGSCCTMIKNHMARLFGQDSPERKLAHEIAGRTFELSDFLVNHLGVEKTGARFPEIVTYHDSCHLLRELGISSEPRRLIENVEEIEFREMANCERCCGFGGTFSVKFAGISSAMGQEKIRAISESGARFVIADDASCLMQIDGLLRRQGSPIRTLHLAQLLAQFDD